MIKRKNSLKAPEFRMELSGMMCGQEVDDAMKIRKEVSPKGHFIFLFFPSLPACVHHAFALNFTDTETSVWGIGATGSGTGKSIDVDSFNLCLSTAEVTECD